MVQRSPAAPRGLGSAFLRRGRWGACVLGALLALPAAARAQGWNLYSAYSTSYTVPYVSPFTNALQSNGSLALRLSLNGSAPLGFTMDTGSTGMAVNSSYIPGFTSTGPTGWVFYNSSGLLLQGVFNNVAVSFVGARDANGNPATATATIPVLGVTSRSCFQGFPNPCSPTGDVFMFGVGVDRNTMGIGPAPATPTLLNAAPPISQAYNPLVNLDVMQSGQARRGFIITPEGVQLGLTSQNVAAAGQFAYQQLSPLSGTVAGQTTTTPSDWKQAAMAVSINQGSPVAGTILMDTGVNDGFLHVPGEPASGKVATSTQIAVQLLGAGSNVTYSFTVGGSNPQQPNSIDWVGGTSPTSFFNSSLKTYAGFNYLYDNAGGFIGLSANNALSGTNAQVVPVLAASGTLTLAQATTVDIPVYLAAASTIASSAAATFSGGVIGPGSLTIAGTGSVTLGSVNNFAGGMTVQQGTLSLAGTLAGQVTVASGATMKILSGASYTIGAAGFTNAGLVSNAGSMTGTVTNAGTFNNSGTISGSIINTGTFVNTGTITGDLGDKGALVNNGTILGTVFETGTVSGNGTIAALVMGSGGVLSPGNSVGTIIVKGDMAFGPGSVYLVETAASGAIDRTIVGGRVVLNGGTVVVSADPALTPMLGAIYPILTADGGLSGTFGSMQGGLFAPAAYPFLATSLAYTPKMVALAITRSAVAFQSAAVTANQRAVAGALDSLGPLMTGAGALAVPIASQSLASAPVAFNALSGEVYASAAGVMQQQSFVLRTLINERVRAGFGAVAVNPPPAGATGADPAEGLSPNTWISGYGVWGGSDGNGNAASLTRSLAGLAFGADGAIGDNWRAGLAAGYGQSQLTASQRSSSGSFVTYDLAAYTGAQYGPLGLTLGTSYSWHDVTVQRAVLFPAFGSGTQAAYGAGTVQAFGEVRYSLPVTTFDLEPFLGLAYVGVSSGSFNEGGLAATLNGTASRMDNGYSALGVRMGKSVAVAGGMLTGRISVGWQHTIGQVDPAARMTFSGTAAGFTVMGAPIARDTLLAGAGLAYTLSNSLTLSVAYQGQVGANARDNGITGSLSYRF